jgi:hypothetical protein
MAENKMRKTQARVAEREHRRAQQARKERLQWQIPVAVGVLLLALGVGYLVFTTRSNPSGIVKGVNGPHFQADTEKIDLGDQPLGKTVKAAFNVKNTGDGTLILTVPQMATLLEGC